MVLMNIVELLFMIPYGFGISAGNMVGNKIGELKVKDAKKHAAVVSWVS